MSNGLLKVLEVSSGLFADDLHNFTIASHSKPLNTITLSDADAETALAFVQQKLKETKLDIELTPKATASIERLGGRASDLDNVRPLSLDTLVQRLNVHTGQLIYKVRNGSSIEDAVEDIIARGVGELRKNAFGEDTEDAKDLPWTRAQAWDLMKRLAKEGEVCVSLPSPRRSHVPLLIIIIDPVPRHVD